MNIQSYWFLLTPHNCPARSLSFTTFINQSVGTSTRRLQKTILLDLFSRPTCKLRFRAAANCTIASDCA